MKSAAIIRLATEQDAVAIAEIYRPYVEETAISFEESAPNPQEIWKRIEQSRKSHIWLVAEIHGAVLGYAYSGALRTRYAYRFSAEASIYIHQNHHRKALAKALYTALHEIMILQGYRVCYAGMTAPNPASQSLHEGFGYKRLARYENIGYKNGQWHSTEWFVKELKKPEPKPNDPLSVHKLATDRLETILQNAAQLIIDHD